MHETLTFRAPVSRGKFVAVKLNFWLNQIPDSVKEDYRISYQYEKDDIKGIMVEAMVNTTIPGRRGEWNWSVFENFFPGGKPPPVFFIEDELVRWGDFDTICFSLRHK